MTIHNQKFQRHTWKHMFWNESVLNKTLCTHSGCFHRSCEFLSDLIATKPPEKMDAFAELISGKVSTFFKGFVAIKLRTHHCGPGIRQTLSQFSSLTHTLTHDRHTSPSFGSNGSHGESGWSWREETDLGLIKDGTDQRFRESQKCRASKTWFLFLIFLVLSGKLGPIFKVPCSNNFLFGHYFPFCTRIKFSWTIWSMTDNFVLPWKMVGR